MRHEFTFTIYNGDCAVDTQQTNGDLVTFDMYDDGYVRMHDAATLLDPVTLKEGGSTRHAVIKADDRGLYVVGVSGSVFVDGEAIGRCSRRMQSDAVLSVGSTHVNVAHVKRDVPRWVARGRVGDVEIVDFTALPSGWAVGRGTAINSGCLAWDTCKLRNDPPGMFVDIRDGGLADYGVLRDRVVIGAGMKLDRAMYDAWAYYEGRWCK